MSFLEKALLLAEQGFYVFPLRENSKQPLKGSNGWKDATRDPEQIRKWWLEPFLGTEHQYNIGISTSQYNGGGALVVVDIDKKNGKDGYKEKARLELEGYTFTETATQITPTGGAHLIYKAKEAVQKGTSKLGPGLDICSRGAYIVAQGSVIGGKSYVCKGASEIQECPEWIIERCGRALEKEFTAKEKTVEVNIVRARARAQFYLENEAPLAVEGQGGDEATYKVAAQLKDFGVPFVDAFQLLYEEWNERCTPPWSVEQLKTKVNNAYNYGINVQGTRAPEADFTKVEESEKSYLEKLNDEYALLFNEGEVSIIHETVDEKGRPHRKFLKEATFRRKLSPFTVQQTRRGRALTYADVWLDWPNRRQYEGLCFRPELQPRNGYYNLWRGYAYKQTPYDRANPSARLGFDMFIDHAKTNVCGGEEKLFSWMMGYFAHLVQKPYERPLTTLVFRGRKGVGKNVLIERVGKLLGAGHFLVAHDSRYLTSNFNGHLDSCLVLVLDEAFWSGDKSAEGKLKGITTSPEILIERKGKEPYPVDNLVRLVVIGNEDWLVPASDDERRYAVFDIGEGRKQDRKYFSQLCALMDTKGGAEILMHYLKNFDLSAVDVNGAPNTKGLADQKLESASPLEQFWHQCLIEGRIVGEFFEKWELDVEKEVFRRAYASYCKTRNIKSRLPAEAAFSRMLLKLSPSVLTDQRSRSHEDGATPRARIYRFKDLDCVRREWENRMKIEWKWETT